MSRQKRWTSDETEFVTNNMGLMTVPDMANQLGRTVDSVEKKIRRVRSKSGSDVMVEAKPEMVRRLVSENKELKKRLDAATDFESSILQMFKTAFDESDPIPPSKKFYKNKKSSEKHRCHMGVELSDFQLGMLVDPKDTIDLGGYSSDVFVKRMNKLRDVIITVVEEQRMVRPIDDLVCFGLGDYVEGESIFPSQQLFIDMNVADQFIFGVNAMAEFLRDLSGHFRKIKMYGVWGNHGRLGKFGHGHPRSNMDYLMLKVLQSRMKDIDNVDLHVSSGPVMAVKIFDQIHLLRHGDDTTGWMGIPFYGMERDTLKYQNLLRVPIDHAHVGHHHRQASWEVSVMSIHMNGSLCGPTPFGVSRMKMADRPSQSIFTLHPEHGMNWRTPVWLEDAKVLQADDEGIFTPHS